MTADTAVATQGLTKRYNTLTAVDHLDLVVERGEIFGLLGPNGAGKTTTMRMLLGLIRPSSGTAQVLGMSINDRLPQILDRTGSIIENPTFYPFLSGRENLALVAQITDSPASRIPEILALVDLTAAARRKFKTYSLGMKQRLAVGAALINNPDLLILDEPANGLDPAGIIEMRTLMRRLKDEGHTVIISSHVLHEIEQICDRIVIMNRGRVVVQGGVHELLGGAGQIEVQVQPQDAAVSLLARIPWVAGVHADNGGLLVSAPLDRASEVNQALAGAGLYASLIRPHELSLEQYFIDVTEGAGS